jgi:hypothetical protein
VPLADAVQRLRTHERSFGLLGPPAVQLNLRRQTVGLSQSRQPGLKVLRRALATTAQEGPDALASGRRRGNTSRRRNGF